MINILLCLSSAEPVVGVSNRLWLIFVSINDNDHNNDDNVDDANDNNIVCDEWELL